MPFLHCGRDHAGILLQRNLDRTDIQEEKSGVTGMQQWNKVRQDKPANFE
jgi:hypothetical protein